MTTAQPSPGAAHPGPAADHDSQAGAPAPAAETPTRLQQAAAGMAEAHAWKGQQIAKGWRKLVNALRRREEEGVASRASPSAAAGPGQARGPAGGRCT